MPPYVISAGNQFLFATNAFLCVQAAQEVTHHIFRVLNITRKRGYLLLPTKYVPASKKYYQVYKICSFFVLIWFHTFSALYCLVLSQRETLYTLLAQYTTLQRVIVVYIIGNLSSGNLMLGLAYTSPRHEAVIFPTSNCISMHLNQCLVLLYETKLVYLNTLIFCTNNYWVCDCIFLPNRKYLYPFIVKK